MEYLDVSSINNMKALSALLSPEQGDENDEDYQVSIISHDAPPLAKMGPGHIGPPAKKEKEEVSAYLKKNSKDVWSEEEVAEGPQYEDITDPRPQPQYEIILKQNVGTEDLFLGLSRKDPSSMCCEAMLVKIKLPDSKAADVSLEEDVALPSPCDTVTQ
ncbi:dynein axonemal assembly factor 6 isoform 3-T3 [Syngnathus typhle]